jgi:glutamate-1-semialdehyde 2,1-aminomutase
MKKPKGEYLYNKAKTLIPGGNMLLSKRPEMFLPNNWPNYFSRAKGCEVWDLEGNKYVDMSIMGIGTNSLGYGHHEVDQAVLDTVANGNMSTLNCPEEVYLAEKLVEINPWSSMVRFARAGGEANAVAIRIARAASGKDNVAVCGYHGWHDWYLSSNLAQSDNLDNLILPGLSVSGIPKALSNTTFPFKYNDYEGLLRLVIEQDIGTIKMEVKRNFEPKDHFLKKVRQLATDKNIVLIFDECTSGFRSNFGGLHKLYDVEPDMAMFGKALGNGYAITAVVGRRSVMDSAQSTFISSTFWTERIGPSAALKTLEVMESTKSWEYNTDIGLYFQKLLKELSNTSGVPVEVFGLPSLTNFVFKSDAHLKLKTLFTQEMLKKGFLASTIFFSSLAHDRVILDKYFEAATDVFLMLKKCIDGHIDINKVLEGPICHDGFRRLN